MDGVLDENRARLVIQQVIAAKPRQFLAILSHFERLVRLELARRSANVQSAIPLEPALQSGLQASLTQRYGRGLNFSFAQKPELIGGLRVQVGSDVFDGSIRSRLAALEESFTKDTTG